MSRPVLPVDLNIPHFAVSIAVESTAAGSYVKGRFVEGQKTLESRRAAVHPVRGTDRQLLPENMRTSEAIVVYDEAPLSPGSVNGKAVADVVVYNSKRYAVVTSEDWFKDGGYYRAICVREGQG